MTIENEFDKMGYFAHQKCANDSLHFANGWIQYTKTHSRFRRAKSKIYNVIQILFGCRKYSIKLNGIKSEFGNFVNFITQRWHYSINWNWHMGGKKMLLIRQWVPSFVSYKCFGQNHSPLNPNECQGKSLKWMRKSCEWHEWTLAFRRKSSRRRTHVFKIMKDKCHKLICSSLSLHIHFGFCLYMYNLSQCFRHWAGFSALHRNRWILQRTSTCQRKLTNKIHSTLDGPNEICLHWLGIVCMCVANWINVENFSNEF